MGTMPSGDGVASGTKPPEDAAKGDAPYGERSRRTGGGLESGNVVGWSDPRGLKNASDHSCSIFLRISSGGLLRKCGPLRIFERNSANH
jgi:hypothetical protein